MYVCPLAWVHPTKYSSSIQLPAESNTISPQLYLSTKQMNSYRLGSRLAHCSLLFGGESIHSQR